jgi:Cu+-exporting ATPase
LQEAGIGISINAKSELNINAADVVILSENIYKILALVRFLRKGNLFIRLNLFWAFAYNIVIMPIVAGVFYKYDVFVSPVGSCIAMSVSSLLVVGFSHALSLFTYDESLQPNTKKASRTELTELNISNREVLTMS